MAWLWRKARGRGLHRPSGTVVRSSTLISRLIFVVSLLGGLALLIGFIRFGDHVTSLKTPTQPLRADGAAALTGGSDQRLIAGVKLVESKAVPRLLISGVNRITTAQEVRAVAGGAEETYACCIDMGRRATDTIGNAEEAAIWVRVHQIKTLVVITDAYHMPRSLFEMRRAIPDVVLIPYPVQTTREFDGDWWKNERPTRALALEYGKYLVSIGRGLLEGDTEIALKQISLFHKGQTP